MRHLRLLPPPEEASVDDPLQHAPELSERMRNARSGGSIEAALHIWGTRVRASRGADVAWCTTRPPWRGLGRLDNWASPVWLPTAEEERKKPVAPLRLSSLFDRAA
ncbi:MAG: hypothetical protein WD557_09485 [Dehalococcoidia bacterium]